MCSSKCLPFRKTWHFLSAMSNVIILHGQWGCWFVFSKTNSLKFSPSMTCQIEFLTKCHVTIGAGESLFPCVRQLLTYQFAYLSKKLVSLSKVFSHDLEILHSGNNHVLSNSYSLQLSCCTTSMQTFSLGMCHLMALHSGNSHVLSNSYSLQLSCCATSMQTFSDI